MKTVKTLVEKGIPTSVRIDPIIPFLNDETENLIRTLASMGVKHITCSTYKVRPDNWQRFSRALPKIAEKLKTFYFEKGEKISGYVYLPRDLRFKLMRNVAMLADRYCVKFGTCREGLSHLSTAVCDGSWLLETSR